MTAIEAIVMAVLQGVTELFPIEQPGPRGHSAAPAQLERRSQGARLAGLPHGDAPRHGDRPVHLLLEGLVQLRVFASWPSRLASADDRRVFGLVVLATIPAVVIGAALHKPLAEAFGAPGYAAVFLIVNGFLLFFGDLVAGETAGRLDQLNWKGAVAVGFAQCLALIPGIPLRLDHRRRHDRGPQARGIRAVLLPPWATPMISAANV